jgi:ATP-dependent DNA helicase RecG
MSDLDIGALVQQEEGQFFDRKSLCEGPEGNKRPRERRTVRDQVAEYVAAFANAEGGVLVLGVEDDGDVTGHAYPEDAVDDILAVPERRLDPPQPRGQRMQHQGHELLVFQVDAAVRAVMVTGDGFPYRRHDQVVMMGQEQINALKQLGMTESAEARLALDRSMSDLNEGLIRRAQEGAGLLSLSAEDYLLRRRIADQRGSALVLRQAAVLLFARDPLSIENPNACVRIFRVRGTERLTGAQHNVEELPRVEGNLVGVIEETRRALSAQIRRSARLHDLFFREMPEYPTFAWQEAVVNAIAHRDYAVQGRSVEVRLYDDRMEVTSPGGLLADVKLADFAARRRVHAARNPRITRVLTELGVMLGQGEGIPRMIEEMEASWLPLPEIDAAEHGFQVVLRNTPIFEAGDPQWVAAVRELDLHVRQKRVLIARGGAAFTNGDYQELNKVDRDLAYREIKQLVDTGLVEKSGDTGRSVSYRVPKVPPSEVLKKVSAVMGPAHELGAIMEREGLITNAHYRQVLGVSRGSAVAALRELVNVEVLELRGRGRAAHYVRGPKWALLAQRLGG